MGSGDEESVGLSASGRAESLLDAVDMFRRSPGVNLAGRHDVPLKPCPVPQLASSQT